MAVQAHRIFKHMNTHIRAYNSTVLLRIIYLPNRLGLSSSFLYRDHFLITHHGIENILKKPSKTEVTGIFFWGQGNEGDAGGKREIEESVWVQNIYNR